MTALLSAPVKLKAGFPPEYAAKLWRWLNSPRAPNFDDFGARTFDDFARELAHRTRTQRTWAIIADGTVIGYAAFAQQNPICGQFQGIVLAPTWRRNGLGTEAMEQIINDLLASGYTKLIASVFEDNEAIRLLLGKVGFMQEGFLQNATQRDGKPLSLRILSATFPQINVRDTIHNGGV